MKTVFPVSAAIVAAISLACGGSPTPSGAPIPILNTDGVPAWVDASGTPFVDVALTALEPRSAGVAVAYAAGRGWVLVDLDARPISLADASCDPTTDTPADCGVAAARADSEARTCRFDVRDTGEVERVPGPALADGTRPLVEQPRRDVWRVSDAGGEHGLASNLTPHDCVGELAIASAEDRGLFGLFEGSTEVVAPFASKSEVVAPNRVLLLSEATDAWGLYDEHGALLIDGLRPARTDRHIVIPWRKGPTDFPESDGAIAAQRDGSCGWISLDGDVLGGFEPGLTACAPPADGHGFAKTPDGSRWVSLPTPR